MHLELKLGTGTYCYIIYGNNKKFKIEGYFDCCRNTLYLKDQIKNTLGIEPENQILIVGWKILQDSESLRSNGISDGKEVLLNINGSQWVPKV